MIWDELTSKQLNAIDRSVPVILPIAATEQHGAHLPLATDRMIAEYFCRRLDQQSPNTVLVLPCVSVGCSEHHLESCGTLSLTHQTFLTTVIEILETASSHGFHNLVIFNAHGGNTAIAQVALEIFGRRHPACRVTGITWWRLVASELMSITESGPGGVGHACEFETSLMLLIAPALVDQSAIEVGGNIATFDWAEGDMLRGAKAALYRTTTEMTSTGVYGDPTRASREKGQRIATAVLTELRRVIEQMYVSPLEDN